MKEEDRVRRVQARLWLEDLHTLQRGGAQLGGQRAGKPTLPPPPSPLVCSAFFVPLFFFFFFFFFFYYYYYFFFFFCLFLFFLSSPFPSALVREEAG